MRADMENVVALLAEESSQSGVSAAYLAKRLHLQPQRVSTVVRLLEQAGRVQVQRVGRVALIKLTASGYPKAVAWQQERRGGAGRQRARRLWRVAGVTLMAGLTGVVFWWMALAGQEGGVQRAGSAPLPAGGVQVTATASPLPATSTPAPTQASTPTPSTTPTALAATAIVTRTQEPAPPSSATGDAGEPTSVPAATAVVGLPPANPLVPTPVPLLSQPSETVNILLMGADSSSGSWRTDSLIVVSVDPSEPSVSMLSIPRDLYVYVPGWKMSRINTADYHGEQAGYPGGGPGLVKATIEYNLGIRVHFYARADFQGFIKILDRLGGVDVVVDCELHDTFPDPAAPGQTRDIDLLPGLHHLDGTQALWYARSRWNTNDFDRARRQQRVLRGALAQIKQVGLLAQLPELWEELTATVRTDLSLENGLWLAQLAARLEGATAVKSRFIDPTAVDESLTSEGAEVLVPAYERLAPLVAEALAPPDTARARQGIARVEVLNGTAWPAWGLLAADRLSWEGFEVVSVGPADASNYRQTTILDMTRTEKGSPVELLSRVLRVRSASVARADPVDQDMDFRVIVGYDYQACFRPYWGNVHAPTPTPAPE